MDKVGWIADLSESQYELIYNGFSFAVAAMGIGFVYFLVSRNRVAPQYRSAVTMSAMICGIAAYHYWRIFGRRRHMERGLPLCGLAPHRSVARR
jgi:NO-binding membrane sensor protein with MHYT domain